MTHLAMALEARDGLTLHSFPVLANTGLDLVVTDRSGGVSTGPFDSLNLAAHVSDDSDAVHANRDRVLRALNVRECVFLDQQHGNTVLNGDDSKQGAADAVTISVPSRAVAVLVADCVPIGVISPKTHWAALIHAGWRGLANDVIARTLELVTDDDLTAVIGPSISPEGYQVGPEVASQFAHVTDAVTPDVGDRCRLDLRAVAIAQLCAAGVSTSRIHVAAEVTDGGDTFFSDRAARPCGRFGMFAVWRS